MIQWENGSKTDLKVLRAVSIVCRHHPYLLKFLFEPDRPRLRALPEELLKEAVGLSSGEDLLLRVSLDLWSGCGEARVWELIELLDDRNLLQVVQALLFLRTKFDGWFGPVMRQ